VPNYDHVSSGMTVLMKTSFTLASIIYVAGTNCFVTKIEWVVGKPSPHVTLGHTPVKTVSSIGTIVSDKRYKQEPFRR
jgi:hypothetical protein